MIFDIGNSKHVGCWIMAKNSTEALDVAVKIGHIKNTKNARVHDLTKDFANEPGIKELEQQGYVGQIVKQLPMLNFMDLINNVKPSTKPQWMGAGVSMTVSKGRVRTW